MQCEWLINVGVINGAVRDREESGVSVMVRCTCSRSTFIIAERELSLAECWVEGTIKFLLLSFFLMQ